MKAVLSFLLGLFISFSAQAQATAGYFDMTIEKSPTIDSLIVVKVTPTNTAVAASGTVLLGMSFTITWPSSYMATLRMSSLTSSYNIQANGPLYTTGMGTSDVNFRSFGLSSSYPITSTWAVGVPITIMTIVAVQNAAVPVTGNFSINPFDNV